MKGISPLVASVLLIAFTVSISMIIMGWFSTFTKTTTSNISSSAAEAIGCNSAGISIERVYITGTSGAIVVKNSGFVNLVVTGMILNSTGGPCTSNSSTLSKGNITSLGLEGCNGIQAGNCTGFSRAIVTTNCGGIDDTITSTSYVTCS